jgi:putative oxidoreductase
VGKLQSYAQSLLRIATGFTFSLHGFQKLFGFFGGLGHGARAHFFSLMWAAGVLECFGGLLILLGLFTRPVAFLLCGEMAVAYFKQHFPRGFWPIANGGELAVLYCFIFLCLVTAGAGPVSLDRIVRKK